jgi:N-acetylglutamate synthase-like GNAT family acetyltransferase
VTVKIREVSNKDADFYSLVGPFLSRKEIVRERGSSMWDEDGKRWFVAIDRGRVVGVAGLLESARGCTLVSAYVIPEKRRSGVYTELLNARLAATASTPVRAIATQSSVPGLIKAGFKREKQRGRFSVMVKQ